NAERALLIVAKSQDATPRDMNGAPSKRGSRNPRDQNTRYNRPARCFADASHVVSISAQTSNSPRGSPFASSSSSPDSVWISIERGSAESPSGVINSTPPAASSGCSGSYSSQPSSIIGQSGASPSVSAAISKNLVPFIFLSPS